jgi:hypothetical protein
MPAGTIWVGGSARAPLEASSGPAIVKAAAGEPGFVTARCFYEDKLFGPDGYTGESQALALRHVDAELVSGGGAILAKGSLQDDGTVRLALPPDAGGEARLRLWSSTRLHERFALGVLDPVEVEGRIRLERHALESTPFGVDAGGVDLGTLVFRDPDGFGRVQAFHVLDVALDAWEALASPAFGGEAPADSLRLLWGPKSRLRVTASGGNAIQLVSPGSGDTDGWSDAVILHEIGHFVARRLLRDDSRGGVHLLGDVDQDLSLAYSEGLATAFGCMVRAQRAGTRRNAAGAAADAGVSWYVDLGMPPPDGVPGGAGFAWDVETQRWADGTALLRTSLGSESNVAGAVWDLADDAATPDGTGPGDDDPGGVATSRLWLALRGMRDLPGTARVTLEDFWHVASNVFDASEVRLLQRVFIEQARIPFVADAVESDETPERARQLGFGYPARVAGGVVIDEIDPGVAAAVEITNRGGAYLALAGWSLRARRNGATTNPGLTYTFPAGTGLAPGARLVVHRGGRADHSTALDLFAPAWTAPWFPQSDGAVILADASGAAVDFVRWDAADGTPSAAPIPAETGFAGRVQAAGYGRTLARRAEADLDAASDFGAAVPTLGLPNDAATLERTFYPAGDVDALRLVANRTGVYTLQVMSPRNGAEPYLELQAAGRPRLVPRASRPDGGERLTLWLRAGDEVLGTVRHLGTRTRYGTYTLAAYAETEPRLLLPPEGIEVRFAPEAQSWELQAVWWNAGLYDSLHIELDGGVLARLPGRASSGRWEVEAGAHELLLRAFVFGLDVATPVLDVHVEPLPRAVSDDFDTPIGADWELEGGFGLAPAPGRSGDALADSPDGDYGLVERRTARLRRAVLVAPGATLCFDHICIARPEDTASLDVSDDWGSRWTVLRTWSSASQIGGNGEPDWSDGRADPEDWVHECIALDAFAGRPVQVRFRLETDIHGTADGWYVDDLKMGSEVPASTAPRLRLGPAVPNPFNPRTRIEYEIPRPGAVVLRVLDVRGRLVRTLFQGSLPAGAHQAFWEGDTAQGLAAGSGVYVVRLQSDGQHRSTKIVLVR